MECQGVDSTVSCTLEREGRGTRLFVVHDGSDPDYQCPSRRMMGGGWQRVSVRIAAVIEEEVA
jgi:hypothetical protein